MLRKIFRRKKKYRETEYMVEDNGFDDESRQLEDDSDEKGDKVVEIEEALKYVSRYFIYHADQRLKTFRYFLIYLAAITTVFYTAYSSCKYDILLLGALASLAVTIIFWCLECRNKQLVSFGSDGCQLMEQELAKWLPPPPDRKNMNLQEKEKYYENLKIVTRGEKYRRGASYRTGLLALFIIAIILHSLAIVAAFYQLCISKEKKCETRIDEPIQIEIEKPIKFIP